MSEMTVARAHVFSTMAAEMTPEQLRRAVLKLRAYGDDGTFVTAAFYVDMADALESFIRDREEGA